MSQRFKVADWTVHPRLNRITRGDETVQLEPKVMSVLVCLAESPGEAVQRDELLDRVWNGTHVTEDTLTRSIRQLRKAFDDDARDPEYIETIRKVGYRLIAPVDRRSAVPPAPPSRPETPAATASTGPPSRGIDRRGLAAAVVLVAAVALGVVWLGDAGRVSLSAEPVADERDPPARNNFPLTSYPGNEDDPAVSPDGRRVAFSWTGPEGGDRDVWVRSLEGGAPVPLTSHPGADHHPVWMPDGERLAFIRQADGGCEIFTVEVAGGTESALATCRGTGEIDYDFSPGGDWLARSWIVGPHGGIGIRLTQIEGAGERVLTEPASRIVDHTPRFSPDGSTVAFIRRRGAGVEDIWLIPAAGGPPRRLTHDNRGIVGHDWSADGGSIIFSSNRGGTYGLWRVAVDGGEPRWLAGGSWKVKHPSVARSGDIVAYENWIYEVNVWEARAGDVGSSDESRQVRRFASTQWDYSPRYSPDGSRVAFVSTRSGTYELWLADLDDDITVQLTRFGGPVLAAPRWSPDGGSIAFEAWRDGNADVWIVDALGGPARRLTSGADDELAPSFSADGSHVYYGSSRGGTWNVWRVPVSGDDDAEIILPLALAAMETPDGDGLVFVKDAEPGIWLRESGGGEETLLVQGIAPDDRESWAVDREGLLFVRRRPDESPWLVLQPVDGGPARPLMPLPEYADRGFDRHPEGETVLYARIDRAEADIMLLQNMR
ncbi:MAG: winged helix-turn-helix domain-containing protein [Acidobacteriota bacterium]